MKIENLINEIVNTYNLTTSYAEEYCEFMDSEYSETKYYAIVNKNDEKFYKLIDNLKNYINLQNLKKEN